MDTRNYVKVKDPVKRAYIKYETVPEVILKQKDMFVGGKDSKKGTRRRKKKKKK